MMKRELPKIETVSSLDAFGSRRAMIPLEVRGFWHSRKKKIQWILLAIFLILPWIKIGGNPVILLNITERKFSLLGAMFFAHDAPLLFFIFAFLAFGIAFVTAIWGRVWCGYACPQTVFIERIYRKIEEWTEGSAIERRKLASGPATLQGGLKTALKWLLFFVVSSIFAHSFAAYFVGSNSIMEMVVHSPRANWTAFVVVSSITALLLFDFGWFREQFCIIMCPYGRFQSVLMDSNSLAVIYDEGRGEPRRGMPVPEGGKRGDCISCFRCVEVCPTGIDIRQGVQMECIACTACIDACDEMMDKVKKPRGLIRYDNVARKPLRYITPRNAVYATLLLLFLIGLGVSVARRSTLDASLIRAIETPYKVLPTGEILNHFKFHFRNQSDERLVVSVSAKPESVKIVTPIPQIPLSGHRDFTLHFFTQAQATDFKDGSLDVEFLVIDSTTGETLNVRKTTLLGPKR